MSDLKSRNYRHNAINDQFLRVLAVTRDTALQKVIRDKSTDRIALPIPYDPRFPNFSKPLHNLWKSLVEKNPEMRKIMPKPIMVCYQRPKNMRDTLVRAQLPPPSTAMKLRNKYGFKWSNSVNCLTCKYSRQTSQHKCEFTGQVFPITSKITCKTRNTIYSCTCLCQSRQCNTHPQYVGQTKRPAHVRFTEHRNSVKSDADSTVGHHYSQKGHGVHHMLFLPFEHVKSSDPYVLQARESYWISQYQSVSNGLNIQS